MTGQLAGAGYGSPQYWVDACAASRCAFRRRARRRVGWAPNCSWKWVPGAALTAAVDQSLSAERAISVPTMAKDRPEIGFAAERGRASCSPPASTRTGRRLFAGLNARRVELPTYGFARQRFWLGAGAARLRRHGHPNARLGAPAARAGARRPAPGSWWSWCASMRRRCWGIRAVDAIDADRAFGDLGFDSMTGVELRNRLTSRHRPGFVAHADLRLPDAGGAGRPPSPAAICMTRRANRTRKRFGRRCERFRCASFEEPDCWKNFYCSPACRKHPSPIQMSVTTIIDSLSPDALIAMALSSADEDDAE